MRRYVSLLALVLIAVIELYALHKGINGIALSLAIGAICTLAGVNLKHLKRIWSR